MSLTRAQWRTVLVGAFAAGTVLRLAFIGSGGFPTDIGTFQAWADRLQQVGPSAFYAPDYFSDYPPAFLYVLWALGEMFAGPPPAAIIKALSIPFDLAIAAALYLVLRRVSSEALGSVAVTLYLLNPALVHAGTYWGQVDAAGALPVLGAALALGLGRFGLAGALAGLAAMVKPQFGVAFIAVEAAALIALARERRAAPFLRATAAAAAVVMALALPFRLDPAGLVDLVRKAADTYPYTSLYAFNVWAVTADFWRADTELLAGLTFQAWGTLLFGAALAGVVALLWREAPRGRHWGSEPARDVATALIATALLALAFYFLPTRVHERYLFPAIALIAPFAAAHRRVFAAYLALSGVFFLSLHYAFTRFEQYTRVRAPEFLEATLYQRPGVVLLVLVGLASAAALVWWWWRREARDLNALSVAESDVAAPRAAAPIEVPDPLREGRRPTRRDLGLALVLALLVLLTRGYRLDWPRDMYFDEVYHARTAMELLAGKEPYEWTHPHLAKELMAASIALFGNLRAVGTAPYGADATAFAAANDGTRAYAASDQAGASVIVLVDGSGRARESGEVRGRVVALAIADGTIVAATTEDLVIADVADGRPVLARLPAPARALAFAGGRIVVATATEVLSYTTQADLQTRIALADTVALWLGGEAGTAYAVTSDGTVHAVDLLASQAKKVWSVGARVASLAVEERSGDGGRDTSWLFVGDADAPVVHRVDLETSGTQRISLETYRTGRLEGGVFALAKSPRTKLVWALTAEGAIPIEPNGGSPFAIVRDAAGARALAVDDARDRIVAAVGKAPVEISGGRVAFAWRLPGVVLAAVLAFFLYLLARRLFRSPLVPPLVGGLALVDPSMFTQARIAMNDVYVGAAIVAGWYLVVAAHQDRSSLGMLLAGIVFGLGLAAKWAAGPPVLAVGVVTLAVTAAAWIGGRPGSGGPLDLLSRRGLNAVYLAFCFIATPAAIYFVSYIPWFGLGHQLREGTAAGWSFVELQQQMYWYHSQLTAPHAAGSPWWAWPLNLKPVYWQYAQAAPDRATFIYAAGNLVTWWAGIPAMAYFAYLAVRTRAWQLAIPSFAFAVQYLQWVPVTRVLFQYHFFTALPFYLTALAAALAVLWQRDRRRPWVLGVLCLGAAWFVLFYPWLSAVPIPGWLGSFYQSWLPTWRYDCQFYPTFRCG